jgi:hypothetical protein
VTTSRDLGFGGEDKDDNYWPLKSEINRRAYHGYNNGYILHYRDTKDKELKAQPIGGLIGRWFTVKDFLSADQKSVPDESGTKKAGTEEK